VALARLPHMWVDNHVQWHSRVEHLMLNLCGISEIAERIAAAIVAAAVAVAAADYDVAGSIRCNFWESNCLDYIVFDQTSFQADPCYDCEGAGLCNHARTAKCCTAVVVADVAAVAAAAAGRSSVAAVEDADAVESGDVAAAGCSLLDQYFH